jgi:hypothetical protein
MCSRTNNQAETETLASGGASSNFTPGVILDKTHFDNNGGGEEHDGQCFGIDLQLQKIAFLPQRHHILRLGLVQ